MKSISKAAGVGRPSYFFLSKSLRKSNEEFIWTTHISPVSKANESDFLPWENKELPNGM